MRFFEDYNTQTISIEESIYNILSKSIDFARQAQGKYIWSGSRDTNPIYSKMIKFRQSRVPGLQALIVQEFTKNDLLSNLYNSMFVTGNPDQAQFFSSFETNEPHAIFPAGQFNVSWNPAIMDIEPIHQIWREYADNLDDVEWEIGELISGYINGHLSKAIDAKVEILLSSTYPVFGITRSLIQSNQHIFRKFGFEQI